MWSKQWLHVKIWELSRFTTLWQSQMYFYQVRAIVGPQSYLVKEYEELWSKNLSSEVEKLLR